MYSTWPFHIVIPSMIIWSDFFRLDFFSITFHDQSIRWLSLITFQTKLMTVFLCETHPVLFYKLPLSKKTWYVYFFKLKISIFSQFKKIEKIIILNDGNLEDFIFTFFRHHHSCQSSQMCIVIFKTFFVYIFDEFSKIIFGKNIFVSVKWQHLCHRVHWPILQLRNLNGHHQYLVVIHQQQQQTVVHHLR